MLRRLLMGVTAVLAVTACAPSPPPQPVTFKAPCEGLILQIRRATSNRFDYSANRANDLADEAEKLLNDKNSPGACLAKAQEAANTIQMPLQ